MALRSAAVDATQMAIEEAVGLCLLRRGPVTLRLTHDARTYQLVAEYRSTYEMLTFSLSVPTGAPGAHLLLTIRNKA